MSSRPRSARIRHLVVCAAVLTLASVAGVSSADVVPPGRKGVAHDLVVDNLGAFPDHVFIVYPTSNHGYGYVLEAGKPINGLLVRDDWKGPGSRLYAMAKKAFDAHYGVPNSHPHGDNREMVQVVPRPPKSALVADAALDPPGLVERASPLVRVDRTFRITVLEDDRFEVDLVRRVDHFDDGTTRTTR